MDTLSTFAGWRYPRPKPSIRSAARPTRSFGCAEGLRSVVRTEADADKSLAQRLKRPMDDHAVSGVESTHTDYLPDQTKVGHHKRAPNSDIPNTIRPHFSGDINTPSVLIDQRSADLELHTLAQRALELSLFIDEPLH
ncbi:hypothetical protein ABZW96_37395 [Nocardia sp. NPDC004168]|uniref:hypothetical protein n=1 Tax=Nocardia sp. NPDC004168 TaxID=3154452 RepID=UPI0033A98DC1